MNVISDKEKDKVIESCRIVLKIFIHELSGEVYSDFNQVLKSHEIKKIEKLYAMIKQLES